MGTTRQLVLAAIVVAAASLSGCAPVGPEFTKPESAAVTSWPDEFREQFEFEPQDVIEWWQVLEDPVLNELVSLAHENNNNLKIAGLRVLEARAILGIATGNLYPQAQFAFGDATAIQSSESNANTGGGGDLAFTQYNLGASASWEMDFWGRFRRGVEAADASFLASVASYDDALVLLAAQVADTYAVIRTTEAQLRIARENVIIQERSFEITDVLYRRGSGSELDALRARTLLLSTQASIPAFEAGLRQAQHALSTLLGMPPSDLSGLLGGTGKLPSLPVKIMADVPAEMLRQRPDIRRAELLAVAQNAQVGVATANLYPSFSLVGTLGLAAAGGTDTTRTGASGFSELFRAESLTYTAGASFVWPFLNYGRIENSIRVEDARLQQALIQYQETVLQAAREVEDAMIAYISSRQQDVILTEAVKAATRSAELSILRFQEGLADYQRVIDAQQSQITQQNRYVSNKGNAIRSLISVYRALGGGWQAAEQRQFVDEETRLLMEQRTDWDDLLEMNRISVDAPEAN